jgi:hypothetical protein
MPHPAFEIIRQVDDRSSAFYRDYDAGHARYKEEVWSMPVWISGAEVMGPNGLGTQFNFFPGEEEGSLFLPVYLREAQAIAEAGDGKYVRYPFSYVLQFANVQRFTMVLIEGEVGLHVMHPLMINLRDMGTFGDGEAMTDEQIVEHGLYARVFAVRARDYCALQDDVACLHIVRLAISGVRVVIVAILKANNFSEHSEALEAIAGEIFLPGWRVIVSDGAPRADFPVEQLMSEAPIYVRPTEAPKALRWWQKFGKPEAPVMGEIPLIHCALLPETT